MRCPGSWHIDHGLTNPRVRLDYQRRYLQKHLQKKCYAETAGHDVPPWSACCIGRLVSVGSQQKHDDTRSGSVCLVGLGASFGPLMLFALYSKKANNYGAIAGIVVGGTVAGLWAHVNGYFTDVTIPAMIPGFLLSALSIYCVSAFTERAKATSSRASGVRMCVDFKGDLLQK